MAIYQYARPISDVAIGNWLNEAASAVNLYASIDEVSASDADYIRSAALVSYPPYQTSFTATENPISESGK